MTARIATLLFALLLVLSACSPKETDEYPEQVRENFVTSCSAGGAPEETCACMFDEIEETIPFEEYAELEGEGSDAILADDRIQEAADACR